MIEKINKIFLLVLIGILFLISGGCEKTRADKSSIEIPEVILAFSTDKDEDISYIRIKHYDGSPVKEFGDKRYKYEVDNENKLKTIFLKREIIKAISPIPEGEELEPITKDDIILKSEEVLKRLGEDTDYYKIRVIHNDDKNKIKSMARQFEEKGFNGNNIYMQYLEDGTLVSVSFKYEESGVLEMDNVISVEEAFDIVITSFSTGTGTEKYSEKLDPEKITYETDVYNGKKVYNFYFRLALENGTLYDFVYIVSTETGVILYRDEP